MEACLFDIWQLHRAAPYHYPVDEASWLDSVYADTDSDGRKLFSELITETAGKAWIQYGTTAFGFDDTGALVDTVHHNVIRNFCFDPQNPEDGQQLLHNALQHFGSGQRVYAFFHYFGMSVCGRHGKLHESSPHVEQLLFENGFVVEHENVFYSHILTPEDAAPGRISLCWKPLSPGSCREFAAKDGPAEIGWGQIHFLPQGNIAYLRWIFIDSSKQHQGYGTAVMHALFHDLSRMGIQVFDTDTALSNTIAQNYYEKTGFSNKGITKSYYTK